MVSCAGTLVLEEATIADMHAAYRAGTRTVWGEQPRASDIDAVGEIGAVCREHAPSLRDALSSWAALPIREARGGCRLCV
jgi:hypothetical protein